MLPRVQEGFASLAAAIEATRRKETGGIVTVCAPPSFAARWLVPRLGSFSRAHPDIDLRLSSSVATIDSRDKMTAGEGNAAPEPKHDLMIRFGRGHYPGGTVDRLFSPAYVTVCNPALLAGEHPLREPRDLLWHTLIHDATVPDLDDRPGWAQWLSLAGVADIEDQLRGSYFEDAALAVTAAMAGQGVVLAARPLVSADVAEGRLVIPFPHSIPSRYAYYVTTPEAKADRPTVLALRAWLVREAARERAAEAGA
jgi:LysR family glycine cleavage system transcriptional activator